MSYEIIEVLIEIIEQKGFKKINNSMWRKDDMTMQNTHITHGETLVDRILNSQKGLKACYKGKFIAAIENEQRLNHVLMMYSA